MIDVMIFSGVLVFRFACLYVQFLICGMIVDEFYKKHGEVNMVYIALFTILVYGLGLFYHWESMKFIGEKSGHTAYVQDLQKRHSNQSDMTSDMNADLAD